MTSLLQKINELDLRIDNISTSEGGGITQTQLDTKQDKLDTSSIISINSVSHDVGGGFNSNTHTFTCPIPGRYIFSVGFYTNGNNSYAVDLKINDVTYDRHERAGTGAGGNTKQFIVVIAVLSIGDIVYAECILGSIRVFAQNVSRFYGCSLE